MKAIIYTLKVWLTSLALGSTLYYILRLLEEPVMRGNGGGVLQFAFTVFKYSLIFSLPSFVLLMVAVALVNRLDTTILTKKLMLSAIGILLTLLPFYLLGGGWYWGQWAIRYAESYGSLIVLGIWIYRLSPVEKADEGVIEE
jgi:hypothetical protein